MRIGNHSIPKMSSSDISKLVMFQTYEEAEKICERRNYTLRVAEVDGQSRAMKLDHRFNRINVYIKNDKIYKTTIG